MSRKGVRDPGARRPGSDRLPVKKIASDDRSQIEVAINGLESRARQPGESPALQVAHPVGQRHPRHTTKRLETLGQAGHGRLLSKVVGEGHETHPRRGQHGAEHEQRADLSPVEHHHIARPHTPGRRPRWFFARHVALASATRRRKFRADPTYPAAAATTRSRFAVIRPFVRSTLAATSSATPS